MHPALQQLMLGRVHLQPLDLRPRPAAINAGASASTAVGSQAA